MGTIYPRGRKLYVGYQDAAGKWQYARTGLEVGQEKQAKKILEKIETRVAAGVEHGERELGPVTVRRFAVEWLEKRKALGLRNTSSEEGCLRNHVYSHLGDMPIGEVRPRHVIAWVEKLRGAGKLAQRSVHGVYGIVHVLFRDAVLAELADNNPCVLSRHQLGPKEDKDPEWRAGALYTREELEALVSSPMIPPDRQVLYGLQGIAGLRIGEAVGLCWRNYDTAARPLAKLVVARSYANKSTKTNRARYVPVHATLGAILAEWKLRGWEEMVGRKPTAEDLIIPSRTGEMRSRHHTRNKLLDDLKRLAVRARRGHDLRRTFITLARVDGARADLLEMVTHTPGRSIINIYTSMPWPSLCAEVAKLNVQRRKGELIVLPVAVGEDGPQMAMFDAEGQAQGVLGAPKGSTALTTVRTTVQGAPKLAPGKLWDVRHLLKKALVEAPGIELEIGIPR